jgi:hypothetical protein
MMPLPLAQNEVMDRLTGIRQEFERSVGEPLGMGPFLLFLGAGTLIVVMLFILQRMRLRKALHIESRHPMRLFSRALRSLGIGWTDRCILRWIAGGAHMSNPTVLLLNRPTFDANTQQWLASVGFGPLRDHFRQRLASISKRAFGAI